MFVLAVAVVLAFGYTGHRAVEVGRQGLNEGWAWDAYRTLRLFFAELDVPAGTDVPALLWIAAFAAPLILLGGLLTLLSERARDLWTRHTSRNHVVIVGLEPFAVTLARSAVADSRVVVVHAGDEPEVVVQLRRDGVRTLLAATRDVAQWAAVGSAKAVYVLTGDDRENAILAEALGPHVEAGKLWVRLDDPASSRLASRTAGAHFTAFGIPSLVAEHVLSSVGPATHSLVVVGEGREVEEIVIHAARAARKRSEGLWSSVTVVGRDATVLVGELQELFESRSFELWAIDDALRPGSLGKPLRRRLQALGGEVTVIVAGDAIDNGQGVAFAFAEELAGSDRVFLVSERQDVITSQMQARTQHDSTRATISGIDVLAEMASLEALGRVTLERRLRAANVEGEERKRLDHAGIAFVEERFPTISAPAREVLAVIAGSADYCDDLEAAGISIDLSASDTLVRIVSALHPEHRDLAFDVWCEAVRRTADPSLIAAQLPASSADALWARAHRLATLKARALDRVRLGAATAATTPILVIAGGASGTLEDAQTARAESLLRHALDRPRFPGRVYSGGTSVGIPGAVGDMALATGVEAVGHFAAGTDSPEHPGYERTKVGGAEIDPALSAWEEVMTDLEARERPLSDVRFVAFTGGEITRQELLMARALGVEAAFISLSLKDQPLAGVLVGGDYGIVWLPDDAATIRAWLHPGRWPEALGGESREQVARRIHEDYVEKHRARKDPNDLALAPWSALRSDLKASNLAAVDDLSGKLAFVGMELRKDPPGTPSQCALALGSPSAPEPDLEQLAELEHGRYNAERLRAGWAEGRRDLGRRESPFLKPWTALDDEARLWDREIVVATVEGALASGYSIVASRHASAATSPPTSSAN